MMGRRETLVIVGALFLTAAATPAFAQAAAAKPQQPATAPKFVTPFKGDADVEMTPGATKRDGNLVVTTFKVKNVSKGPLVGFKVDEYWYNAKGDTISGSQSFRVMKPFMPGEVVDVTLKSPSHADMSAPGVRKMTMFAHANGKVKPKQVPKFSS
jgi:hypothetical protein